MKATINAKALASVLTIAANYAGKNGFGISSMALFTVNEDELTVRTASNDQTFTTSLPVTNAEDGSIAVSIDKLASAMSKVFTDEIELSSSDNNTKLNIKSVGGRMKAVFHSLDGSQFPKAHVCNPNSWISIDGNAFATIAKRIVPVAETAGVAQEMLKALHLEYCNNVLYFSATNGKSLGYEALSVGTPMNAFDSINIPFNMVPKVLLAMKGEDVKVAVEDKLFYVQGNGMTISIPLFAKQYCNWRRVVPANVKQKVTFQTQTFLAALELAGVTSEQKSKRIDLTLKEGKAILSSINETNDALEQEIDILGEVSEEITFAFNKDMLAVLLKGLSDTVVFGYNEKEKACKLTNVDGEGATYVIMPMNMKKN